MIAILIIVTVFLNRRKIEGFVTQCDIDRCTNKIKSFGNKVYDYYSIKECSNCVQNSFICRADSCNRRMNRNWNSRTNFDSSKLSECKYCTPNIVYKTSWL